MATIRRFEEILAWQRALLLANGIYGVTCKGAVARDYAFRDQIRRSALSVMLNIAEGFARATDPDFRRFLSFAHGSVAEVQSALYLSLDQNYITQKEFDQLFELARETSTLISRLQKYLSRPLPP